jgi:radical SAM superfamily enzyme YgiQ (UPF0313 family)
MKILYVNPGKINSGLDYVIKGPPLALLCISAMVPEHEAKLYDFKVEDYNEKEFRMLLKEYDVVAISSMTPQIEHAYEVATMAKAEGNIVIIGGYHPTLLPDEVAKHPAIDFLVRGEGEHTFKAVIDFIDGNNNNIEKQSILGISYNVVDELGNIHVIHNKNRPLESNLDNFPLPRRNLLNYKEYNYMGGRVTLMETSRGCPHNCNFCCIIKMWNDDTNKMRYRTKSIKRIMQEIYSIDREYWDFIFFSDDNFTINIKRTKKILDTIIKSNMHHHIMFSCQTRVDTLSKNPWLAPLMKKASMKMAFLGIESVHQQSLDAMGKHTNIEMIQEAVEMCHDNGIAVFGGVIIGFPGETVEMVRENIDFAIKLKMEFVQFTPITAFPGTPFFNEMKEKGQIATYNYKYYNLFHPMLRTKELSFVQMYHMVAEAYAKYYNNAAYLKLMISKLFQQRFKWLRPISFRWFKQFAIGGLGMLHQNGITVDIVKKLRKTETNSKLNQWRLRIMSQRERYRRFKLRLNDLKERLRLKGQLYFQFKSIVLRQYFFEMGMKKFGVVY